VHYAIDYLVNPDGYDLGESVAIIGAGNAAVDVARTAIRKGARKVTIYARGTKAAASRREVEYAIADGVEFVYGMNIKRITDDGPIFTKTTFDEEGNALSYSKEELYPADTTIISISQGPKDTIVNTTNEIATTKKGLIWTDNNGNTTREGVFAGGDVVKGAKTVVEAVAVSKVVADSIDAYLTEKRNRESA